METLEAEQQNTSQMLFEQIIGLVLSSTTKDGDEPPNKSKRPWLHWSDVVSLVQVNRYCYTEYAQQRDVHLAPLLKHLEDSTATNRHYYRGEVYAPRNFRECTCDDDWYNCPMCRNLVGVTFDPRYKDTYNDLSVFEKCAAMVNFLEQIVCNIRSCFHWEDLSDPAKTSKAIGHPRDWVFLNQNEDNFKNNHAIRRATYYMNLLLIMYAQFALRDGNSLYFQLFNIAFWGLNDIDHFNPQLREIFVTDLRRGAPYFDKFLLAFQEQHLCPEIWELKLLGRVLVNKICLTAPLIGKDLPTDLEVIPDEILQEHGYGGWVGN